MGYDTAYAAQQVAAYHGRPPTAAEVAQATNIFQTEVRVPRAEFHARHVVPDRLMAEMVNDALRLPTPAKLAAMRDLFVACGAHALVAIWDQVAPRAVGGSRWAQRISIHLLRQLRRAMTNIPTLFVSESQGNLQAGTHLDMTEEGVAILGRPRVRAIIAAAVDAMNIFGLGPRLRNVGNSLHLSYEGAAGEFRQYGYDSRRSRDQQTNVLALAREDQRLLLIANSSFSDRIRYFVHYHPVAFFFALIALAAGLIRLVPWDDLMDRPR